MADLSDDALRGMEARLAEGGTLDEGDVVTVVAECRRLRVEAEVLKRFEDEIDRDSLEGVFDARDVQKVLLRIRAEVING